MKSKVCIADGCGLPLHEANRCKRTDIAFAWNYCQKCGAKKQSQTVITEVKR